MVKLALILCVSGVSLLAQWPNRPTPGVPRTAVGKADLTAPPPRTADGKPDLSGIWKIRRTHLLNAAPDLKPGDIQPWAAALYKQAADGFRSNTDGINCLPPGPKASITNGGGYPMKIVQTPGLILVLYEYQTLFRQIFTDGRALPKDPQPSWNAYSTGKWQGDTLVVESNGFRDDLWMDMAGTPLTNTARVIEKFRRPNYGTLLIEAEISDPKAFTKPWTLKLELKAALDTELIEEVCLEGERSLQHLLAK